MWSGLEAPVDKEVWIIVGKSWRRSRQSPSHLDICCSAQLSDVVSSCQHKTLYLSHTRVCFCRGAGSDFWHGNPGQNKYFKACCWRALKLRLTFGHVFLVVQSLRSCPSFWYNNPKFVKIPFYNGSYFRILESSGHKTTSVSSWCWAVLYKGEWTLLHLSQWPCILSLWWASLNRMSSGKVQAELPSDKKKKKKTLFKDIKNLFSPWPCPNRAPLQGLGEAKVVSLMEKKRKFSFYIHVLIFMIFLAHCLTLRSMYGNINNDHLPLAVRSFSWSISALIAWDAAESWSLFVNVSQQRFKAWDCQ